MTEQKYLAKKFEKDKEYFEMKSYKSNRLLLNALIYETPNSRKIWQAGLGVYFSKKSIYGKVAFLTSVFSAIEIAFDVKLDEQDRNDLLKEFFSNLEKYHSYKEEYKTCMELE